MSTTSTSSKPTSGWQPPTLEEMQAMLPQYQFECLLGRGGMGAVYKAVQASLDRAVAIKVLPGDLIDDTDAQFAERFKNEARTMAKMNHPAIVNVYDFGETQTGLLYIVMEFIDGTDVAKMISSQGRLPEDYALSITAHVCDALNYAHRSGVIHRDIKPANILINMDGAVKVADFGLAKQSDAGQSGLTKTNMAMGTPDFVAPEALIPGIPLDGRADLYAIGVMLYQMLTGEIPRGIWTLPGMKLGTDPRFDAIITKAMQTDRDHRYQSAADLRRDLDTILMTPRALLIQQQQATAEAAAHATRAQKQHTAGHGAVPASKTSATGKKNFPLGPILGIAATIVLGAGLYVMLTGKDAKKTAPGMAATPGAGSNTPSAPASTTPSPASPSPAPPAADAPKFAGVEFPRDLRRPSSTAWQFQGDQLVCANTHGGEFPSFSVPVPVKDSFEIELAFSMPPDAQGYLILLLPARQGWTSTLLYPDRVATSGERRATKPRNLKDNTTHVLKVAVHTRSKSTIWVDGEPLFDHTDEGEAQPRNWNGLKPDHVHIGGETKDGPPFKLHSIRVTPLEDSPSAPPPVAMTAPAVPPAETVPPATAPVPASSAPVMPSPVVTVGAPTTTPQHPALPPDQIERVISFQGHRYRLLSGTFQWQQANARAKELGAHLATITSREEQEFVRQSYAGALVVGTTQTALIGAHQENKDAPWTWITGERFEYSGWRAGEPCRIGTAPVPETAPCIAILRLDGWDDMEDTSSINAILIEWDIDLRTDPRIAQLEKGFKARLETDAEQPFRAAVAKLNQGYLTAGLSKARAAAQAKGGLFEVTMLDAEKSLIEKGGKVPTADPPETTAALKSLRDTYRGAFAKYTTERDAKAAPLYDLYLKAIDAYIAELTKAGKTDTALSIQALRDEIATQKPVTAATVAATAATPKTALTPAPKAPVGGGSSWRVAAEFLVNNGGTFVASKNGGTGTITKAAEIPAGKFDIIEINFDRINSVLPPPQDADFQAFNGLRDLTRFWTRPMSPSLTDAAFAFLASNPNLVFLNLEGVTTLTDGVTAHLANAKKLDYLGVQYATQFTGSGMAKLPCLATLTNIEFLGSGITDDGLKALTGCKKLLAIRITSPAVTAAGFAALASIKTLATLTVSGTSFGDEAAGLIATMPNLTALDLSTTKITDLGLQKLKTLKKLTSLNLGGTPVTLEAAAAFQKALPQCRVSR